MYEKDIQELRRILTARQTDELETMNKLIVEILEVRTKIAKTKKEENEEIRGLNGRM